MLPSLSLTLTLFYFSLSPSLFSCVYFPYPSSQDPSINAYSMRFFFSKDVRSSFPLSWGLGRKGKKIKEESPTAASPSPSCIFERKLTDMVSTDESVVTLHHVPASPSPTMTPTSSSTFVEGKEGHHCPLSPSSGSDSFYGLSPGASSSQSPSSRLHVSPEGNKPTCQKKLLFPLVLQPKERTEGKGGCDACFLQQITIQKAHQQAEEAELRLQEAIHRQTEVEQQLWLLQDSFRKMFGRLQKVHENVKKKKRKKSGS